MSKKETKPTHAKLEAEAKQTDNHRIIKQTIRQAPIPDPQEFKEYKQIDKSFPDRIMKMAEKEQKFRHLATYIGQSQFILLVLGGYSLTAYVGLHNAQWTAAAIAVGVSYVAYVFKSKDPKPPTQKEL